MSSGKISIKILLSTISVMALFALIFVAGTKATANKVTICHAAGQADTTHYVQITAAYNAIYGQAGHFSEPGTTAAGHENDYEGACEEAESETDFCQNLDGIQSSIPEGYELDESGNCVQPSTDPSPTPTPSPTPAGDKLGFWLSDPGCGNTFEVHAKYELNGRPVSGLAVELKYLADHSYQVTDTNGLAQATFEYKGDAKAYAIAAGYPTQELTPWLKTDCKPGETSGTVLGASTQGMVLGASTMAQTGSADQALALVFTLGSLLTTIGLKPYVSKKN